MVLALKRDLETIKLLRTDLERKNDQLEKLRALYDAVTVQHKSLVAEREREKTRLASKSVLPRFSCSVLSFDLVMGNKTYQPDRFTHMSTPIDTIHEENQQLKQLVNTLGLIGRRVYGIFVVGGEIRTRCSTTTDGTNTSQRRSTSVDQCSTTTER